MRGYGVTRILDNIERILDYIDWNRIRQRDIPIFAPKWKKQAFL